MEVTNDLLAGQQRVVAHVVDRDFDPDRFPGVTVEPELAGHSPGFGFQPLCRFAEQRLLRRFNDPRSMSVEVDDEILVCATPLNGAADALR